MLLFWRIRYLDTSDKEFKDRDLWLDTNTLGPVKKAAIEAIHDLRETGQEREMLRFKHLFREQNFSEIAFNDEVSPGFHMSGVSITDYFEDENGNELSQRQMAEILTGDPNAVLFSAGTRQYEIDFAFADRRPISIDQITLSPDALNVLGCFTRDLRKLRQSALFRDGPGTLSSNSATAPTLQTAATDEQIRSFVTIFRCLYMQKEPANFRKAADAFALAIDGHPLADWVQGIASHYEDELIKPPSVFPVLLPLSVRFSRKRLIDVFVYTQYAHQPEAKRARQFDECLKAIGGNRDMLNWLFLTEIWGCSLHMSNAGMIIAKFYDIYCRHHRTAGEILASVSCDSPGIGTLETKEARRERVLGEKARELAKAMWKKEGRLDGDYAQYVDTARARLDAEIG